MGANRFTAAEGDGACQVITLTASGTYKLGQPNNGACSSWILQPVITGSGGSFIPKLSVSGSGLSGSDLISVSYYSMAAGETLITANTAVSAAGVYKVFCDGCDLSLVYTADTGSMVVYAYPVIG